MTTIGPEGAEPTPSSVKEQRRFVSDMIELREAEQGVKSAHRGVRRLVPLVEMFLAGGAAWGVASLLFSKTIEQTDIFLWIVYFLATLSVAIVTLVLQYHIIQWCRYSLALLFAQLALRLGRRPIFRAFVWAFFVTVGGMATLSYSYVLLAISTAVISREEPTPPAAGEIRDLPSILDQV